MQTAAQFNMAKPAIVADRGAEIRCPSPGLRCAIMAVAAAFACSLLLAPAGLAQGASDAIGELLEGKAAFGDWRSDAPLVRRKITELPPPYATRSRISRWSTRNGPGDRPGSPSVITEDST